MTDEHTIFFASGLDAEKIHWKPRTFPLDSVSSVPIAVDFWRMSLAGYNQEELQQLSQSLSPDELERDSRYKFESDRNRFMVGRAGMRAILSSYLATPARSLTFEYGRWGKPSLAGTVLEFNVAHCEDLFLLAVSASGPVGIDLERIDRSLDYLAIGAACFPADQFQMLQAAPVSARGEQFSRLWTRKEAIAKVTGSGLTGPCSFNVDNARFAGTSSFETNYRLKVHHFVPAPQFIAALATF